MEQTEAIIAEISDLVFRKCLMIRKLLSFRGCKSCESEVYKHLDCYFIA